MASPPSHVLLPAQSPSLQHCWFVRHAGHSGPPQSWSVSLPPVLWSAQDVPLGEADGLVDGDNVGNPEGDDDGDDDGLVDGLAVGNVDGEMLGNDDGLALGLDDGLALGLTVGASTEHAPSAPVST